jgi:hypothetical protein
MRRIMDADLPDPPEVPLAMLGKWREGHRDDLVISR